MAKRRDVGGERGPKKRSNDRGGMEKRDTIGEVGDERLKRRDERRIGFGRVLRRAFGL